MGFSCAQCGLLVDEVQASCPRCGGSLPQPAIVPTTDTGRSTRRPPRKLWAFFLIGVAAGLLGLVLALTAYAALGRTGPPSRPAAAASEASSLATGAPVGPPSATSLATPSATATKAPFGGTALLTARVPAYCTLPEAGLMGGRVPPDVAGQGNGALILSGPAAPVSLDLDGDKDPETVAVYSCGASGVAAGAHWPDMVVIYGADGSIKGTVGLADHKLLGDTTSLKTLKAAGNVVQVQWLDDNRLGTTMERTGTITWTDGAPTLSANPIGETVTVIGGDQETAFMTPSTNILCDFGKEHVFCVVFKHSWVAPPPASGSLCEIIDYGDYVELEATGAAKYGCTGGMFGMDAWANNQLPGNYGSPAWFVEGKDPIVSLGNQKYYALSYGRTVKAGSITCRITEDGLSCDNGTGGSFFVNRSSIQMH